ncbi:GABA permease [Heliocybe sulcata]|uniref:GABA permease n=1 Tax=Heliocybe sulcata TaxID=5364 RepID=A0A5C3MW09_9AGAM|nr:GABA permease [Heliocybe sulcata]
MYPGQEPDETERLGYKQEFRRHFSLLALTAMGPPSAIYLTLVAPLNSGGPQALFWGWIIVCTFTIFVALSLGELCSAFPSAGGPSYWIFRVASPRWRRELSYVTGWLNLAGQWAFGASAVFQAAFTFTAAASLYHPDYVSQPWHLVLICFFFLAISVLANIFANQHLAKINTILLAYNILGVLAIIITLLATVHPKQTADFAFTAYINNTGWSSHALVFILGLLQSAYTMIGYDSVTHMSEEMTEPAKNVPKALIVTVVTGAFSGLVVIIPLLFCLTRIDEILASEIGSPFLALAYLSTNNKPAGVFLALLPTTCALLALNSMLMATSRTVYAFARDGAFPFPSFFKRVNEQRLVPTNALIVSAFIEVVMLVLYIGSSTLFYTIISLATIGFDLAYLLPIAALMAKGRKLDESRPFKLGRWGWPANIAASVYLTFISATMLIPTVSPVTPSNMNYTSCILVFILLIAAGFWLVQGRRSFEGPDLHLIEQEKVGDGHFDATAGRKSKSEGDVHVSVVRRA